MVDIAKLVVRLVADTKEYLEGLNKSGKQTKDWSSRLKDAAMTAAKFTAGVVAAGLAAKKAFDLGRAGAVVQQTKDSFDLLMKSVGAGPDLFSRLQAASKGTIDDMRLMSSTSTLLAGTQGDLAKSLADATPELLEIAKAAQKLNPSLGDTTFLYESIATGIKRASPLILDNLGLTIKLGEAYDGYARMLGKTAQELDANEQKMALLMEVQRSGKILIDQVGGSTDSATDSFDRLSAGIGNSANRLKTEFFTAIDPLIEYLADSQEELNKVHAALDVLDGDLTGTGRTVRLATGEVISFEEAIRRADVITRAVSHTWNSDYVNAAGLATEATKEATRAAWDLVLAEEAANEQLSRMHFAIDNDLTGDYEELSQKKADLIVKTVDLRREISDLEGGWQANTESGQRELETLRGELDDTIAEIGEVEAAWDQQTRMMLFNLAEQRLGIDGFTNEELDALAKLAGPEGFGLLDETASAVYDRLNDAAFEMVDTYGDQSDQFVDYVVNQQDAIGNLGSAINNLPDEHTTRINFVYSDGAPNSVFQSPHHKAEGGPVAKGRPYWVGEETPELFVPDQDGQIYNREQMGEMMGGGNVDMGELLGEIRGMRRDLARFAKESQVARDKASAL